MLRKLFLVMVLLLLSFSVIADDVDNDLEDDLEEPELEEDETEEDEDEEKTPEERALKRAAQRLKAQTKEELKEMMQEKKEELKEELADLKEERKVVYQNQNPVRLAVHSLIAMEDLAGGIGPQVRTIAREFNNSVRSTMSKEEKIVKRGWFKRWLVGGDEETAAELDEEVARNRVRVKRLKQLKERCDCDTEILAALQEQIRVMELEQTRLSELSQKEKKSKGIFNWFRK